MLQDLLDPLRSILSVGAAPSDVVYAYLDPGTGSLMLQALIGGVAAGSLVLRKYWQRIKGSFASRFMRQRGSPDDTVAD